MSEEKKAVALNENTLEDVTGGVFKKPSVPVIKQCPCGADIPLKGDEDTVRCFCCGRLLRVANGILIEVDQG